MPLHRRVPKRGFTNIFRVEYDIVNLSDLDRFDAGAGRRRRRRSPRCGSPARTGPSRSSATGEIEKALTVSAHKFSASRARPGSRRPAAAARCCPVERPPELRQHLQRAGPAQAGPVHVPAARVYRLGAHIPTPGVDPPAISAFFKASAGLDLRLPRHLLGRRAAAALRVRARDHAVHLELDHPAAADGRRGPTSRSSPRKARWAGRRSPSTRATARCCSPSSRRRGIALWLEKQSAPGGAPLVPHPGWGFRLMTMLTLTTGTIFIMWLGEQITERGIGNGISLIIFAGIVAGLPRAIFGLFEQIRNQTISIMHADRRARLHVRRSSRSSSSSSARSGASRSSTPSASSAGGSTAARTRTCRCGSTPAASSRSSSRSRSCRCPATSPRSRAPTG